MAGTDRTRAPVLGGPRVVLVEPQLGENIGAAARAMLNCGLVDLALVNPREPWPNAEAVKMSSGATEVLDKARVFDGLEAATADLNRVFATTARSRDMIARVVTPRQAAIELRAAHAAGERVGVLFGPERSGLTNDQLSSADTVVAVPLNPAYASLNLAQAVLIVGYEYYQAGRPGPGEKLQAEGTRPASKRELENFLGRLEHELDRTGFFRVPDMRPSMLRSVRAIFQRPGLTDQEVRTLHGILSSLTESWRRDRDKGGGSG
ncbi:MAG: RNA methyltransferase [Alphaproteobacteria bacterium]